MEVNDSDLAKSNATYVHLWKEYSFGDIMTALAYANQLQALKSRNQSKDAFMDTFEYMTLPGWITHACVYLNGSKPLLLSRGLFIIMYIILLSWPYKLYMEWVGKKGGFTMKKRVSL
jgi:hypothetical protein